MEAEDLRQRVAENFKRLRIGRGWTQAEAAEAGDVDPSYVGQIETAQITFGTSAQRKWAGILGVDISEFTTAAAKVGLQLNPDEEVLIQKYRELTERERKAIWATIKAFQK